MVKPFPIPLNALRAIEAVARRGALGPAAEELGVTPGAISQHIKRAEDRLGVRLFERGSAGLVPLPALTRVQPMLHEGFQTLSDAFDALRPEPEAALTITAGNVFISRWLVWRLSRFQARHPELELRMVTTGQLLDLARPDLDCGIRFGAGYWAGTRSEHLGGGRSVPVCHPDLARRLHQPQDLALVPVIADQSSMLSWPEWLAGAGAPTDLALAGPSYSDPSLAFDAAMAGQGVLLAVDLMAADAVESGRLVQPFAYRHDTGLGYWFSTDNRRHRPKRVHDFLAFLQAEIACSEAALDGLPKPDMPDA